MYEIVKLAIFYFNSTILSIYELQTFKILNYIQLILYWDGLINKKW